MYKQETRKLFPCTAAIFDFDGTISTLRCGWEEIMAPMMVEYIGPGSEEMVKEYIAASTGIQTIYQMKWLAEQVEKAHGTALDPWEYKDEYNRRLMVGIEVKKQKLLSGEASPEDYLMAGAVDFLQALRQRGVRIYVASGTDHPDVQTEAGALGILDLFDELRGAPVREEKCSKEAVLRTLMEDHGGSELTLIGDGKVEISLGKAAGARTIGIIGDERRRGVAAEAKRARLTDAGAELLTIDFTDTAKLLAYMGW